MKTQKLTGLCLAVMLLLAVSSSSYANPSLDVAKEYKDAVVKIMLLRSVAPAELLVTGTGFVISESGLLLTNFHVVEQKYHHADLKLVVQQFERGMDEYKLFYGTVIKVHPEFDLALVKITSVKFDGINFYNENEKEIAQTFNAVTFYQDQDNEALGKEVTTVGFPSIDMYRGFEEDDILKTNHLFSQGTILGKMGKDIKVSCPSIVPGASGSPVFSENGVIGIAHAMYYDGYTHFGLFIPLFRVLPFLPEDVLETVNIEQKK